MAKNVPFAMRLLAAVQAAVLIAAVAADEQTRELLRVGEPPSRAEFIASDASGNLQFRDADGTLVELNVAQLVRWSAPASPRAGDELHLVDGSRFCLAAAWDGEPSITLGRIGGKAKTNLLGGFKFNRSHVRTILWQLPPDDARRQQIVDRVLAARRDKLDALLLDNGDYLSGTLLETGGSDNPFDDNDNDNDDESETVTFSGALGRIEPSLDRVRGVALSPETAVVRTHPPIAAPKVLVGLRDGSLIAADSLVADGEQLVVTSAAVGPLRGADRGDVVFLQSLAAGVEYLSDLESAEYRHEPYLEVAWPFRRDRNVLGGPLTVSGQRYLKGIAMHSASRLTFALQGEYGRFAASVAVDGAAEGRGSVVFRVFLKHGEQWQPAYASPVIRGGDEPLEVAVELADARELALVVDYADRGDERDYANWLDARLERRSRGASSAAK